MTCKVYSDRAWYNVFNWHLFDASDTSISVCSSSCAKRREINEAEASLTAPIVKESVLSQASVGNKKDQTTVGVYESGTPELMELEEVPTGADVATAKDSTVPVAGATETAVPPDILKTMVDM